MTDITELAQREKFEAWFKSSFHPDKTGPYIKDQLYFAWKAASADLAEALEKAQQRNAELEAQNEYIRKRYQQLNLLIGKNILVMQAAIIEWQATGDAKNGLAWIYNTLFGPGELPDEAEKDAQAYFDRKYAPLDEELMALHKWFWEQSEAERAAAGIKVEAE
ncbi:ead/Ea22-like family protein [Klebsiella variicola]|uniref:ead/Ea22-like family protein n=1 Tax=Klebsiella variicola TaxID=244366 RepID=UPI00339C651F